jgi:hypothetical protein
MRVGCITANAAFKVDGKTLH